MLLIYASQEPEHKTSILHNWHFAPKACSMLNKSTCFVLFTDCFHFCNYWLCKYYICCSWSYKDSKDLDNGLECALHYNGFVLVCVLVIFCTRICWCLACCFFGFDPKSTVSNMGFFQRGSSRSVSDSITWGASLLLHNTQHNAFLVLFCLTTVMGGTGWSRPEWNFTHHCGWGAWAHSPGNSLICTPPVPFGCILVLIFCSDLDSLCCRVTKFSWPL